MRKEKEYFANLNEKGIIDNKRFWQTVKPFLSEKLKSRENITLVEKEELVSSESDVAQLFNQFFSNLVKNLDIPNFFLFGRGYAASKLKNPLNFDGVFDGNLIIQALLLLNVSVIKLYLSILCTLIKRQF